ncbi:hypothetical protein QUC31_017731 [Theobroma cacao]
MGPTIVFEINKLLSVTPFACCGSAQSPKQLCSGFQVLPLGWADRGNAGGFGEDEGEIMMGRLGLLVICSSIWYIEGLCDARRIDRSYKPFQVTKGFGGFGARICDCESLVCGVIEMRQMNGFCKLLEQLHKLECSVIDALSKFFSFMVRKEEGIIMAVKVFDALKMKGCTGISIYNILMEALDKTEGAEKVIEVLNEMMQEGFPPDNIICSAIISGTCKYRTMEEARKRVTHTDQSISTLGEALAVVKTMLAKGYVLGKRCPNKGQRLDESYQFSAIAAAKVACLTDTINTGMQTVKPMDEKYQVSDITKSVASVTGTAVV